MGYVSEMVSERRSLPSWAEDDDRWYSTPFQVYGDPGLAGRTVTKESALAMSVVYACITILANSIASLPCYIYERQSGGGRRRATERIADRILTRRPNGEMSHYRYKQVTMAHLAAWGNHYSYVERDDRGFRSALWPLSPDYITPRRNVRTDEIEYAYTPPRGQGRVFTPWEVFHVPGFGYNGLVGKSPITLAREAIGLGLAQEEFGARFYGDGTHPGLVVSHPGSPKPDTTRNLRDAIAEQVGGLWKSHRLLFLKENMKLENITIKPVDAEFITSRELQTQEICRFYRMPPHMVADLKRATFSNIEHQGIEFVVHTLGPWLSLLEAEFSFFFLTPEERKYFYFEFLVDKFLRGDIKNRYAAYQIARNSGWMNADEIRTKENMDPMPDGLGKIYIVGAGVQSLAWLGGSGPGGEEGGENLPAPTPFALVKMLAALAKNMAELRERINIDTRGALKGGLDDLEERMTDKMSVHALEFSGQLSKASRFLEKAFDRIIALRGEEQTREATALMAAVKKTKAVFIDAQKHNAAEQQRMWEALKTLPGISDNVDLLRTVIADSGTALQNQVEEVKSFIKSTSGKLSKKMSRELQELTDLAANARTRLDEGLIQLSESSSIEDAVGALRAVVTATQEGVIEKLDKIRLDTDPIVAAFAKSREEVDARFAAVEDAIKAGITPKMLQGVVQEKFSEGLAGLLQRLDSVEGKLADIVPKDIVKSIVDGGSQAIRSLIEGQEPVDLSPLENAVKELGVQIKEGRQEPVDLSSLEAAVKDLATRVGEIPEPLEAAPVDLAPLENAVRELEVQIKEGRQEPVDLSSLEAAVRDLGVQIKEGRQEPVDLTPLEGAVKDLATRVNEIPEPLEAKPVDLAPLENAVRELEVQIKEGRQEPIDLSSLEAAVKDLGARLEVQIKEGRQEPIDLSSLEAAVKDLATRLDEIPEPIEAKPVDLSPLEDAVKDLSTRVDETKKPTDIDLAPLESAVKDLDTRIAKIRQEPISLEGMEGAVKDLGARVGEIQGMMIQKAGTPKLPESIDLSPIEGAVKDLGIRSGELHEAMSDAASNQAILVASINKIVTAQTQMVEALEKLGSDNTTRGKEWAARSNDLSDLITITHNEIKELKAAATSQTDRDKRLDELETGITEIDKRFDAIATRTVANREKVNSQYLPLIQDALQFIINRECIAVRRALKKFAGKREEMVRWLDDFYGGHPQLMHIKLFQTFASFLEALYTEIAIEGGLGADVPDNFSNFVTDYFGDYVERHMRDSYGYLKETAGNENQVATIDMIDTWHNERAQKVAIEELGRAGEAIIKFVENADDKRS